MTTTQACAMVVKGICVNEQTCLGDEALPTDQENDVLMGEHAAPGSDSASELDCHTTSGVRSKQYTEGYVNDDLTNVQVKLWWHPFCSNGAIWNGEDKDCWLTWIANNNGWTELACWSWNNGNAPSTSVEEGVAGSFDCYNGNFCNSNHYYHKLYTDINGHNDGTASCDYSWWGQIPPDRKVKCYWI